MEIFSEISMGLIKVLYIDPGTGGMLFTVLFGIFGVAIFSFRALIIKIKYSASGDKNAKLNQKKIPIAIFAEDKRYWNTFETVLDEFEKRKQKVVYMTCSKDDPVFNKKYEYITGEFIGEGNKAYSRLNLLNASVVLSSTPSLGVFQWKRSKNVDCYIHIPHMASDIILYRMFSVDRFDAIILPGKYQEKPLRQLEEIHGIKPRDMELCGIPYMDVMKKRLDAAGEVPAHERTVLLAPTWGENGILTKYGERLIDLWLPDSFCSHFRGLLGFENNLYFFYSTRTCKDFCCKLVSNCMILNNNRFCIISFVSGDDYLRLLVSGEIIGYRDSTPGKMQTAIFAYFFLLQENWIECYSAILDR